MWNKKLILFELEYWEKLGVLHSIDNMHVNKNICESFIGTLLQMKGKRKDNESAQADLEEIGLRPELHAHDKEKEKHPPPAAITLSKKEKK